MAELTLILFHTGDKREANRDGGIATLGTSSLALPTLSKNYLRHY